MSTEHGLELPKLPAIDKADIEAVRSFLPGKLLGRTAALLSLILLVIAWVGGIDVGLRRLLNIDLQPAWLRYGLLIGAPLLIVACQLAIEWRAARNRRKFKELAVKIGEVPRGYFRIGPYLDTPEDRTKFDRADQAQENVLGLILNSDVPPLYLTGDSGSGKSSLLNASVVPLLKEQNWTVFKVRAGKNPITELYNTLSLSPKYNNLRDDDGKSDSPYGLLETISQRADGKVLVIIDQFEEFIILGTTEDKTSFAIFVKSLSDNPIAGVHLLLVLRSDYQTTLADIGLPVLRQGDNWCPVGRFMLAAAKSFMLKSGLGLQLEALDRILTSAAEMDGTPAMIRPITLNVLGYVLAQGLGAAPSLDADRLVRRYIEHAVEQPGIRDFARPELENLLTEQGTKRSRSEQELMAQTHLLHGEVRAVLNGLQINALVRPLDPMHGIWEISHDFIANAIYNYLNIRRIHWWRQKLTYLAPTLLSITVGVAVVIVVWSQSELIRVQEKLQEMGLSSFPEGDGLGIRATTALSSYMLHKAGPLLDEIASQIRSLDLGGTLIYDVTPLKSLTLLRQLNLAGTRIPYIELLKSLTALHVLNLSNTQVINIEPLKSLPVLQELNLAGTQVTNIEPLTSLPALQALNLARSMHDQITHLGCA
jgi:hypothetical protein